MEVLRTISEKELLQLLGDSLRYEALVGGGVDNWEWYGDSLNDFLHEYFPEAESFEEAAQSLLI